MVKKLVVDVTPIQDPETDKFPEQEKGIVKLTANSVAICISGGGSRSHTLACGYMRALKNMDLLDNAAYISSVSGGSWASTIYTFAEGSDEELLGKETTPEELTLENLEKMDPGRIGLVVTKFKGFLTAFKEVMKGVDLHHLWQATIGNDLLSDFGLAEKCMAINEESIKEIKSKNRHLKKTNFVAPRKGRPFIILNATLEGPPHYMSGWGESLQMTPMYTGVPFYRDMQQMGYKSMTCCCNKMPRLGCRPKYLHLTIGGGVIDSFAFGAGAPMKKSSYFGGENVKVRKPKRLFQLEDAVGASSAAYVAQFANIGFDAVQPQTTYWPVLSHKYTQFEEIQKPRKLAIGDGGNFENTGLMAALQRGVRKAICFINSAVKLDRSFEPNVFVKEDSKGNVTYKCADSELLSFFGVWTKIYLGSNYTTAHVFDTNALNDIMDQMLSNIDAGKGAYAKVTLGLLDNSAWNIVGGDQVEVLFVYNEKVTDFENRLPEDTRKNIQKGEHSYFQNFPYYKTTEQNPPDVFSLERREVNLLAAQAEFFVKENAQMFRQMLG